MEDADRKAAAAQKAQAVQRYTATLDQMCQDGADIDALAFELKEAASEAGITEEQGRSMNANAITRYLHAAVADDLLTADENERVGLLVRTLGVTWDMVDRDLALRATVAGINGRLLPVAKSPQLMAKKGEIVHLEWFAALMKEVAVRQYQGGYQGVSIPIGKTGVRYRVGASRGHSVQVGTQLQVADSGTLAITSRRAVYMGSRKTVEMPYSKVVNLSVFDNGVQFHLSNRVNAPMFILERPDVLAALVNAVAQREAGTAP